MRDTFSDALAKRTGVINKAQMKALSARSDQKGLAQLAGHLLLLAVTSSLVWLSYGSWLLLPAMVAQGIVLVFLFAPLHETIHRTAFRGRLLNDGLAKVCGLVLFLPPDYFRAFHFAHHRHTQDPARDPELASPKADTLGQYLVYITGIPYWMRQLSTLAAHAFDRVEAPFITPGLRATVVREARLYLLAYGMLFGLSLVFSSPVLLVGWWLPVILGQPALRLYLLAEHTGCPEVPDMLANSRTTLTTPAVRFLAWNMPFHVEHHAYPALPFHALPQAHELIRDRIEVLSPGYLSVHRELAAGLMGRSAPSP